MHPFLTQWLDHFVIRLACACQPKAGRFSPRFEQAVELLQHPDLFSKEANAPAEVKWTSRCDFRFQSSLKTEWPENDMVYARLLRVSGDWQAHPTIVLLHGWNDEIGYTFRHPYVARKLISAGVNVAMLQLPFHLRRRPRSAGAVKDFISEDLFATVQAAQQAVADTRALLAWIEQQGSRRLGLWGVSLGGWLTGLILCHEPRAQFGALSIPVTRMDLVVQELAFCEPLRRSINGRQIGFERLNLRSQQPKTTRENILIVEAEHDLFASRAAIEELWETWNKPEIWRIRHAHISACFSVPVLNRTIKWLAAKAKERR